MNANILAELKKRLDSPDEEIRREAIERLMDMQFEPKMLPLIQKAMGDESWRVRKSAVNAAVAFPDAVSSVAPLMIDVLHSEDNAGLRNSSVEGLTRLGREVVPYLIHHVDDEDHDVRKFIVDILGDIWISQGDSVADERIVDALIKATEDTDENVRLSAIEGLGKIGSARAVDTLLALLEKGDSALKFTSLEALGNIGRPVPMKGVYKACSDRLLRRAAYDLIGKVGGIEAVPYVIDGLKESSTSGREAAITALKRLAASPGLPKQQLASHISQFTSSHIEKIAASLKSQDVNVQKGAVLILNLTGKKEAVLPLIKALSFDEVADEARNALIELGDVALDVILHAYPNQDEKVRALLCSILGEIGDKKAEDILIHALRDNYGHVRSAAVVALGKITPEKAAPEILNLLQDEFDDVRDAAVDALCSLAKSSEEVIIPALMPLLSLDDPHIREKAIIVLGRIGGREEIKQIWLAIKDDSPIVRKAAVHAIEERQTAHLRSAQAEPGPERYAQDIILAIADENREVRLAAVRALGNLRSREAVGPLLLTLNDEDIWVRASAVESLGKIGSREALRAVKELVDDDNGMIVCAAIEAMGRIAAQDPQIIKEVKPWVAKCIARDDAEVVKIAIQVLGRIDGENIVRTVLPLLEHQSWDVRAQAVDFLSKDKDNLTRSCLEERLTVETDDLVKQRIVEALKGQVKVKKTTD